MRARAHVDGLPLEKKAAHVGGVCDVSSWQGKKDEPNVPFLNNSFFDRSQRMSSLSSGGRAQDGVVGDQIY